MSSAALIAQAAQAPPEVADSLYHLARGEAIRESIRTCTRCPLHESRRNAVPFSGTPGPIAFIGEAPGAEEDISGLPFVGRSGQVLTDILESMGLRRYQFPILNTIACRPPRNDYSLAVEADAPLRCTVHFKAQLDYLGSWCLVLLGGRAVSKFMPGYSVGEARKKGPHWTPEGHYIIPTYHPAFTLRNPAARNWLSTDLSILPAILAGEHETPFPKSYDPSAPLAKFNGSLDSATVKRRFRIDGYIVLYTRLFNDTIVVTRDRSVVPRRHLTLPRYTLAEICRLGQIPNQAHLRRVHVLKRELGVEVTV